MKFIKKALRLILVLVLALSLAVSAYAAGSTIDQGQTASLDIYKYALTAPNRTACGTPPPMCPPAPMTEA